MTDEPKMKLSDVELEEMFYDKLLEAAKNIVSSNRRSILRDMRNKLKTLHDGTMKVNFMANMTLYQDNEITLDMSCQYDIKGSHKDKLDRIEIKYQDPDLFDDEEENILADGGIVKGDLFEQAKEIVLKEEKLTTSFLQRKLKIGYNRAAELTLLLLEDGVLPLNIVQSYNNS